MAPVRTCIGCRRTAPQAQLLRVALGPERSLVVARTAPGRGAWLCAGSVDCLDEAVARQAFPKALKADVGTEAVDSLRVQVVEHGKIWGS